MVLGPTIVYIYNKEPPLKNTTGDYLGPCITPEPLGPKPTRPLPKATAGLVEESRSGCVSRRLPSRLPLGLLGWFRVQGLGV